MTTPKQARIALFAVTSLLPLVFFWSKGTTDYRYWTRWIDNISSYGIRTGYRLSDSDYPPFGGILLAAIARISAGLGIETFVGFKISLYLSLLLSTMVFLAWTRNLLVASMLQLSLTLNCMALGYIDVYFAPLLILSLWALSRAKLLAGSICFILASLIKWQPLILVPTLLVYLTRIRHLGDLPSVRWQRFLLPIGLPVLAAIVLCVGTFGIQALLALGRAGYHRVLSGDALNANWIATHLLHVFQPEKYGPLVNGQANNILIWNPTILLAPKLVFALAYVLTLRAFMRSEKSFTNLIYYSVIGYLCYYTLNSGVHENHLFLATILAATLAWLEPRHLALGIYIAILANINLLLFYGFDGQGLPFSRVVGVDLALVFSIISVTVFAVMFPAVLSQAAKQKPAPEGGPA
jgi:hypothetical protein